MPVADVRRAAGGLELAALLLTAASLPLPALAQETPGPLPVREEATLSVLCPDSTRTAPSPSTDRQLGRPEFLLGVAAAEDERWGDAVTQFRASYALSGSPIALYNMALAFRALSSHRRARDAFCTLAQDARIADADMREESRTLAASEAERVASLVLTAEQPDHGVNVTVEGDVIDLASSAPQEVELDADRRYELLFDAPGYQTSALELMLSQGERRETAIRLLPAYERLEESPALWAIIGGVLLAGAVVAGVVGYFEAQLDATPGRPMVQFP